VIHQIKSFTEIYKYRIRTDPPVSRQDIQECRSAIIAWVVDLPPREPNWLLSKWGSRKGRSHLPTMFSRTLASVVSSEIGLKSFCMDIGGITLGAGMTSADFQIRGTYPSPIIKFTVLPFWYCYFENGNHKSCSKCPPSTSTQADRWRLRSSMAWFTTDWSSSHHTEIRRSSSSSTSS